MQDETGEESARKGAISRGRASGSLLLDLMSIYWGSVQGSMEEARFVWQVDPEVFEVKLFGLSFSAFSGFRRLDNLEFCLSGDSLGWSHVGPGCGGARLIQPRQDS